MKCRTLIYAVLFGLFTFSAANPSPSQKKDEPPKKAAEQDELAKLGKKRGLEAAEKAYILSSRSIVPPSSDLIYQLSVRWLNAELDLVAKKDQRVTAYRGHLQAYERLGKGVGRKSGAGKRNVVGDFGLAEGSRVLVGKRVSANLLAH